MTDNDLLTPREYARYRRCSLRTLDRERAEGRGCPYVRIGSQIRYRRSDIDRYVEAHLRGGARQPEASAADDDGLMLPAELLRPSC
jgi:excisionase family DNA binding protein